MVQRALNKWAPRVGIPVSGVYDGRTKDRLMAFQAAEGVSPADGTMEQSTLNKLAPFFDLWGKLRYRTFEVPRDMPDLGPLTEGGRSILEHDLTHSTGGLDGYPAFDDAWGAGTRIIAPEPLRVYRASSARRRDGDPNGKAFYARGISGGKYWIAHTDRVPPISQRARLTFGRAGPLTPKGAFLAEVSANHEEPHAHCGLDFRKLNGGRELEHHTDYTHGAPTVGSQLRKAL